MKKKSKTTTNQTSTMTTTPTNPEWVTSGVQGQQQNINDFFKTFNPQSLAPGADPLQTQAARGAQSLTTSPNFSQATDILGGVANAGPQSVGKVDIASLIGQFQNPYLKDVVDTSLANFDEGAGQTRAQNALSLAGDSTFGGSGGAIQTALTERGLAQDRAKLAADLRSGAYDRAAALAAQQAGFDANTGTTNANFAEQALARRAAAAGGLADIGATQGAESRANVSTQSQIGEMLRQILAAQGKAPLDALTAQTQLLGSLPYNLFNGQTASGTMNGTTTGKESGMTLGEFWSGLMSRASAAAGASGG